MSRWPRMRVGVIALAVMAVVMGVVVWPGGSGPVRLTAEVAQGPVSKMATASGALAAATTTNLGFRAGNNLKALHVKVGDKVKKGQLLAEEDHEQLQQALEQARQTLEGAQAQLREIIDDVTVPVDHKVSQASRDAVEQAQRNIGFQARADADTIERARGVLRRDERALSAAQAQFNADGCNLTGSLSPVCAQDQSALQSARAAVYDQRTVVIAAQNQARINKGNLEGALKAALLTFRTNQGAYRIADVNRPKLIRIQQTVVGQDVAAVRTAEANLQFAYVYAPADGTVTAVTGALGEFMPGQSPQVPNTPLAPGSHAMIPDVGSAANSDLAASGSSQGIESLESLRGTAPGGGAFIQLADLNSFQVVVPFLETDITKIHPGSAAKLAVAALGDTALDGTVTNISPSAVGIANRTRYWATILLTNPDPRLKSGMSVDVSVVTSTIENKALVVPTSAVSTEGNRSYVNVDGPDGQPVRTSFTRGKVGDDNTEVLGGLSQGQKVQLPPSGRLPHATPDSRAPANAPTPGTVPAPGTAPAPGAVAVPGVDPSLGSPPASGAVSDPGANTTLDTSPIPGGNPAPGGNPPPGPVFNPAAPANPAPVGGLVPPAPTTATHHRASQPAPAVPGLGGLHLPK